MLFIILHKRSTRYSIYFAQSRNMYFRRLHSTSSLVSLILALSEPPNATTLNVTRHCRAGCSHKALQVIQLADIVRVLRVLPLHAAQPIPVDARPKTRFCGRSLAGNAGSNPAGGMDFCVLWCCVLSDTGLRVGLITPPETSYRVWHV
jgi:hypothetical protein